MSYSNQFSQDLTRPKSLHHWTDQPEVRMQSVSSLIEPPSSLTFVLPIYIDLPPSQTTSKPNDGKFLFTVLATVTGVPWEFLEEENKVFE